jgi:ZIP family zinc transporter
MTELSIIVIAAWAAGLAAAVGGIVAWHGAGLDAGNKSEIAHGVIAFGGGILVAAVVFALLPRGMAVLSPLSLGGAFCAGGLLFCVLDAYMSRRGGIKAQFMAMLMDFLPEALALGAMFGHDRQLGMLLAAFIGAQNLPEGFNAFRETVAAGVKRRYALLGLLAASLLGPIAACTGYFFFQDQAELTAGIMAFASGGIIYLIFQDIAPQAKLRRHWAPALGAVLGFAIGMIGKQLIG